MAKTRSNEEGSRGRKRMNKKRMELERDIKEAEQIASEIIARFTRSTLDVGVVEPMREGEHAVDYLLRTTESLKDRHTATIVELAAFSHFINYAVSCVSNLGGSSVENLHAAKRMIVQMMNDTSRVILRLRSENPKGYREILSIFTEGYGVCASDGVRRKSGKTLFDFFHKLILPDLTTLKNDTGTTKNIIEDLTDMLARMQLFLGLILKWCLIAEEEFTDMAVSGLKNVRWDECYSRYLSRFIETLLAFGRKA